MFEVTSVLHVPPGQSVVSTTGGLYLRRAIDVQGRPHCVPMLPHEQLGRASAIGAVDVSLLPAFGAKFADLAAGELSRFRELAAATGDRVLAQLSDEDLVTALGFRPFDGSLAVGALLLFGTEAAIAHHIPTHETALQVRLGTTILGRPGGSTSHGSTAGFGTATSMMQPPGTQIRAGRYLVVGDDDADPAVAQVIEVKDDRTVLLRVLPGHAEQHATLVGPQPA